jgi:hypothetical protein
MMRARTSGVPSESRDHRELLAPVYLRGVFLGDTFAREVGDRFGGGSQHLSRCGGGGHKRSGRAATLRIYEDVDAVERFLIVSHNCILLCQNKGGWKGKYSHQHTRQTFCKALTRRPVQVEDSSLKAALRE